MDHPHPPYSPNLTPADFFFSKVKKVLEGITVEEDTVRYSWARACKTLSTSDFTAAFKKWVDHYERCIEREGGYVEK